jgi:hypothetical protein
VIDDRDSVTEIRRLGGGYAAEGPGFFVWDEDPGVLLRTVQQLQRGDVRGVDADWWCFEGTRRPRPSASNEALDV